MSEFDEFDFMNPLPWDETFKKDLLGVCHDWDQSCENPRQRRRCAFMMYVFSLCKEGKLTALGANKKKRGSQCAESPLPLQHHRRLKKVTTASAQHLPRKPAVKA